MTVRLTDIYEPAPFDRALDQKATELNTFFQSGILRSDSEIDDQASSAGRTGELTYFNPLANAEPNYSTDDPASFSTPLGITGDEQRFRKAIMNQSWSTMDLSRELALKDPLQSIVDKISQYWATVEQRRVINSCTGILLDNIANDSSDMTLDVSNNDASAILDSERLTADTILDAVQLKGDHGGMFDTLAIHSVLYTSLKKQELIDTIRNSEGGVMFQVYMGYRIIVDDDLPAVSLGNRIQYTSYLISSGAMGYGRGTVLVPSELERKASSGDGGGQDIIHTRMTRIIHPYGYQFTSASVAAISPTYAELADATNWNRVYSNKNVGLVFIRTNG